jgi:hypothetical protein
MALSTIETELVNKSEPVFDEYLVGDLLHELSTRGTYGTVTTAGTSNTTAATATAFHGPNGIVYCTSSGYYTLAAPVAGCHLTWFHGGATDLNIRSLQSGNAATGPSFHVGTGTTYTHIHVTPLSSAASLSGMSVEFVSSLTYIRRRIDDINNVFRIKGGQLV